MVVNTPLKFAAFQIYIIWNVLYIKFITCKFEYIYLRSDNIRLYIIKNYMNIKRYTMFTYYWTCLISKLNVFLSQIL